MYVRIVFALCCLRGKQRLHNKKSIFISYAISRIADFERYNWLKTIIFIKSFNRSPLGTLSFFVRNRPRRNCTFRQYYFVYKHHTKNPVGVGSLNLINILFRLAVFLVFSLLMMSGTRTQKNCRINPRGMQLSRTFAEQAHIDSHQKDPSHMCTHYSNTKQRVLYTS